MYILQDQVSKRYLYKMDCEGDTPWICAGSNIGFAKRFDSEGEAVEAIKWIGENIPSDVDRDWNPLPVLMWPNKVTPTPTLGQGELGQAGELKFFVGFDLDGNRYWVGGIENPPANDLGDLLEPAYLPSHIDKSKAQPFSLHQLSEIFYSLHHDNNMYQDVVVERVWL